MKKHFILLIFICTGTFAQAATITVDQTTDEADGNCADGDCSLRDAITVANGNGEADIITIPDGTYTLTQGTELTISSDITLQGTSQTGTIIEAHTTEGSATHRVFQVTTSGIDVTFQNMTIRHGVTSSGGGGGVFINLGSSATGTATFTNVTISNNRTTGSSIHGGGIYIADDITTVTLTDCIISNNTSGDNAGGIYQGGAATFTMTRCVVSSNTVTEFGGGLSFNEDGSTNTLINCVINGNTSNKSGSDLGGGIMLASGTHILKNCTIYDNETDFGGGIYDIRLDNDISLYHCTIANNTATDDGGGILLRNTSGSQSITNCIVVDNTAGGTGNDIYIITGSITNANDADHSWVEDCGGTGNCPSSPAFVSTAGSMGSAKSCNANNNLMALEITAGSPAENIGKPNSEDSDIPTDDICGGSRSGITPDAGSHEIGTALLPVELVSFTAQATDKGHLLTWITASELNNAGFEIQRSVDGREWTVLDFVAGHGTTQETQVYNFVDRAPLAGVNYYRLKQMDFDFEGSGEVEYSHTVSVEYRIMKSNNEYRIFPNPVKNELTIVGGEGQATIYNLIGQPINEYRISNSEYQISTQNLPKGQYILHITRQDGSVVTRQFVKN